MGQFSAKILGQFSATIENNQVIGKTTGSTGRRRLDLDVFEKLLIPVPERLIRSKVIDIYRKAFKNKKTKEYEANSLLSSIDDYLLKELGIVLPEKDFSLKSRIFRSSFSKITGNRFDPSMYSLYNYEFFKSLNKSKYHICRIKDIANVFQGVGRNITNNKKYILLKVKNIQPFNRIDFSDIEYIQSVPIFKLLIPGDIISPFIGEAIRQFKFSVFPIIEGNYTVDNNTGVIRLDSNNNSIYISTILASVIGKHQIENLIGGGVPFLGSNSVNSLFIPVPKKEIQDKMSAVIENIMIEAHKLQKEAIFEIEYAKQEVEKILLG